MNFEALNDQINFRNVRMHERLQIDRFWFGEHPANNVEQMKIDQLLKLRNEIVRKKFANRTERIRQVCKEEANIWPNSEIFPSQYTANVFREDRNRHGGGVLVAFKND